MKDSAGQLKEFKRNPIDQAREIAAGIVELELQDRVLSLANEIRMLVESNKHIELEKGKKSRQIGSRKISGKIPPELLAEIKTISKQLKANEALIKCKYEEINSISLAAQITSKSTSVSRELPDVPSHFRVHENQNSNAHEQVRITDTFTEDEWQDFVNGHPNSTAYHDIKWRELLETQFFHNSCYLVARGADNRICGVLPAINLKSKLFGNFFISMPYFNYGGPLAYSQSVSDSLLQYLSSVAENLGCTHAEIRETQHRPDWPVRTEKVSMTLNLPDTVEGLDQSLKSKTKSQVRLAEKSGAIFKIGKSELLDNFYAVYSHNMRDLGSPCYDKKFFKSILNTFPHCTYIASVTLEDKPVACGFLINHKDKLEIPWASSLRSANKHNVNMFLYRNILDEAIRRECSYFDFGRSTLNSPTYHFKKQWGATPQNLYWHYWLADGTSVPKLNPDNPKFKLAIKIWQHLPVAVTNYIGPIIAKNLP